MTRRVAAWSTRAWLVAGARRAAPAMASVTPTPAITTASTTTTTRCERRRPLIALVGLAPCGAGPGGRPPGTPDGAGPGGRPPGTPDDAGPGGRPPGTSGAP